MKHTKIKCKSAFRIESTFKRISAFITRVKSLEFERQHDLVEQIQA